MADIELISFLLRFGKVVLEKKKRIWRKIRKKFHCKFFFLHIQIFAKNINIFNWTFFFHFHVESFGSGRNWLDSLPFLLRNLCWIFGGAFFFAFSYCSNETRIAHWIAKKKTDTSELSLWNWVVSIQNTKCVASGANLFKHMQMEKIRQVSSYKGVYIPNHIYLILFEENRKKNAIKMTQMYCMWHLCDTIGFCVSIEPSSIEINAKRIW